MGRSQETFSKKEREKKKEKRRKDKEQKRLAKKEREKSSKLEDMIAYVDENGNLTTKPPDPTKKKKVDVNSIEISIPRQEDMLPDDGSRSGIVSFFNDAKGFGFIKDSITKESVFVHIQNVEGDIRENSKVTYFREQGQRGPIAKNVIVL